VRRRLVLAATVAALAAPLVAAEGASACSCVPPDPEAQLEASDGAFVGRLLAVREVEPREEGEPIGSGDPMDYVYRVGRVYKRGPGLRRGRRVKVRSARSSATCGLPTGRGRLYGLYVQRSRGRWHGSACQVVSPAQMRRGAKGAASAAASPGSAGCG
jgi:hypothetical protein